MLQIVIQQACTLLQDLFPAKDKKDEKAICQTLLQGHIPYHQFKFVEA